MSGIRWRRACASWLLFIGIETLSGIARNAFLAPVVGDQRARQVGFVAGCGVIVAIAWLTAPWLAARARGQQLRIGGLWMALTLLFEVAIGLAQGFSWDRILAEYDPARGGLMWLGLMLLWMAPGLGAWLRAR